jgi:TIR domain
MSNKRIFMSHAHADRALADLLRDTLVLGGVHEEHIFYSSSRATGIPSGENVRSYLQRALRETGLLIELVSETFLTRPMCLIEHGAAWVLGIPIYPVIVPSLDRDLAVQQLGNVQVGYLGTAADVDDFFDELHDRLAKDVGIQTETARWNRAIRKFKSQLASKFAVA